MVSKISLLSFTILLTGCIVQKPTKIEITSPNFNPYFGHQHITLLNDAFFIDTSFYPDLSLQPFVEKLYFKKNIIIQNDLKFRQTSNESLNWLRDLSLKEIKRLSNQSRKTKLICDEYRLLVETKNKTKFISIYNPIDSCENINICKIDKLFKQTDSISFVDFYK